MKYRKNYSKKTSSGFMIYGINGVNEILNNKKYDIKSIYLLKGGRAYKDTKLSDKLQRWQKIITVLLKDEFLENYDNFRTQGIVVNFEGRILEPIPSFNNSDENHCLLAVDNLEDPQNLGQIIRTSECAGVDGIIIPEHKSVGITNSVLQVSQGAFTHIKLHQVTNLRNTLKKLKDDGFWIVALENGIDAKHWHKIDYTGKIAIVVGSEGKGIRPLVLKECDFKATIPMKGKINSLNVSASVSAILFERQRQIEIKVK
jgi:23S rRNA (guanosine2251-2'-O)-methyltransferase